MPSASILRRTSAILSSRPSASTNRSRSVATKSLLVYAHGHRAHTACSRGERLRAPRVADNIRSDTTGAGSGAATDTLSTHAVAGQPAAGVREDACERRKRVLVGGDPVGVAGDEAAKRALDPPARTQRLKGLHALGVDADRVILG